MRAGRVMRLVAFGAAVLLLVPAAACAPSPGGTAAEPGGRESATRAPAAVPESTVPDVAPSVVNVSPVASAGELPGLSSRTTRGHVWAEPLMEADQVALSASVAALGDHVHLEVPGPGGVLGFIGYFAAGEFYLRAAVCPNCAAERIDWGGTHVVCRECSTTFDIVSGVASGERRGFPLGVIPYHFEGGDIVLSLPELVEAWGRTASGEQTIFPLPEAIEDDDRGDRSWPRCCVVRPAA